jgi:hypothetical protein
MAFFIDFKILKNSIVNTIEETETKKDSSEPYELINFVKNLDIDNIGNDFVIDSYNKYLIEWTKIKNQTTEDFDTIRRQKYVELLQNIQLNYLNQDEQRILGNIDWENNLEIEVAIPFFVEKIKDIIEYYINKRRDVKNSKAKWSTKGSKQFLEKFISQYIIDNYTKNENTFQRYKQGYQELSSFQNNFKLEYSGLYDLNDYRAVEFEVNPSSFLSSSGDYDLSSLPITSFYDYNPDETKIIEELKKELYKKYVSVDYNYYTNLTSVDVDSTTPFFDPYNYETPFISRIANDTNLLRDKDIGYYFTSKYIYTSNYFSPFGVSVSDPATLSGLLPKIDVYRSQDYKDYYSWGKYNMVDQGLLGKPVTDKRLKRFYGYQSRDLNIGDSVGGVERYTDDIQLWSGGKNETWTNEDIFDKFSKNVLNRTEKNEFFFTLGDNESLYKYVCDIYGNQYYLIKEINTVESKKDFIYTLRTTISNEISVVNFSLLGQAITPIQGLQAIEIQDNIVLGFFISTLDNGFSVTDIEDFNTYKINCLPPYNTDFYTDNISPTSNDTKKSLYEYQYTVGKLYVRDVNSKHVKPIGEFLDDSDTSNNIKNRLINIDIVNDFIIFTTDQEITTGKIKYDFSTSDLIFSELNKNTNQFLNQEKSKTASYWYDSKNNIVLFSNVQHDSNVFSLYYITTDTNTRVDLNIDVSGMNYDYQNIMSFRYMSKPQLLKDGNNIYLVILLSDFCENYYYQIIKYELKSKKQLVAIYNKIYHPSNLKITSNIKNDPLNSPELAAYYDPAKTFTNKLVYYWDNELNKTNEFTLTYSPYESASHYDNDVGLVVNKNKPSTVYYLSDLVSDVTPSPYSSSLEDVYVFNGGYVYTVVEIVLDFRNIVNFPNYVPSTEPIYKIEYVLNGKVKTQYILENSEIDFDSDYADTGISPLSALGTETPTSLELSGVVDADDYETLIGLNKPDGGQNIGIYNNIFQTSPINMKYISFKNINTNFTITFFSLNGKRFVFEFNFTGLNFALSEKYNKVELLDVRLKETGTEKQDCILYLNTRKPDSIINTSLLNI